ncbi:hypothetical protein Tco_0706168 [Tanacetum coccineum]|uniref:Uncharacterized protein n=1 Tax=Tanacetum coccineum TaxID=301880 RepID=A0ABQ4Y865_9ASTR
MVKGSIVLGLISKSGLELIELSRSDANSLSDFRKGVRYKFPWARRFLPAIHSGFLENCRPLTHLFEKETPFVFSEGVVDSFNTPQKKIDCGSVLNCSRWGLPCELICAMLRTSAIGAVLGHKEKKNKHFQP